MSDLRTAALRVLEALGLWATGRDMDAIALNDLIFRLEAALAEPQEPVVKEIASALNAMRAYALDNPCHYYKGVMQDPNGVHAWLARNEKPVSEYERGFIDGMQKQARRSVDKAVNAMAEPIIEPEIKEDKPVPPPEAQTEAEKIAYCAGWWAALEAERKELLRIAEEP